MLDENDFLDVIKKVPLVSIDLVIRSSENSLLMGKRNNEPASGYWFVPGGRIKKDETLEEAFLRITTSELAQPISIEDATLLGVFTHKYSTNFSGKSNTGTHYVVIAYELKLPLTMEGLPKEQHSAYRWMRKDDLDFYNIHKNSLEYFKFLSNLSKEQYIALNSRRDHFNNLLWQTPALSLVAQAFLFNIILNNSSSISDVTIATLLAVATSISSRQLLDKHRAGELRCAKILDFDEKIKRIFPINDHANFGNKWIDFSSYKIWSYILPLFGIAAIIALAKRFFLK